MDMKWLVNSTIDENITETYEQFYYSYVSDPLRKKFLQGKVVYHIEMPEAHRESYLLIYIFF